MHFFALSVTTSLKIPGARPSAAFLADAMRDRLSPVIAGASYAVGLTKRGTDGAIVEGADDPLRAALADPVARPERVEAGVECEDRVVLGEVAHRSCHRLRMDAILAARGNYRGNDGFGFFWATFRAETSA